MKQLRTNLRPSDQMKETYGRYFILLLSLSIIIQSYANDYSQFRERSVYPGKYCGYIEKSLKPCFVEIIHESSDYYGYTIKSNTSPYYKAYLGYQLKGDPINILKGINGYNQKMVMHLDRILVPQKTIFYDNSKEIGTCVTPEPSEFPEGLSWDHCK